MKGKLRLWGGSRDGLRQREVLRDGLRLREVLRDGLRLHLGVG